MPPAIPFQPAIRPRSLANVLLDLREARRDVDAARLDVFNGKDAEDRVTEAETRQEDLRDEFDAKFEETNGFSIADLWKAREDALL